jgi:hypothetical protein
MSMIETGGAGDGDPRISGWDDSHSTAVITWRGDTGGTQQQEVTDQREAIRLLRSIDEDESLTLISAQLRRAGTGPAS